jgi:hypothetical protein
VATGVVAAGEVVMAAGEVVVAAGEVVVAAGGDLVVFNKIPGTTGAYVAQYTPVALKRDIITKSS